MPTDKSKPRRPTLAGAARIVASIRAATRAGSGRRRPESTPAAVDDPHGDDAAQRCDQPSGIPMTGERLRTLIIAHTGAFEDLPFGPGTLVYKVGGKMFAIVGMDDHPLAVSLKCDPGRASVLRAMYAAIRPGYHLNKLHWNTVTLDGTLAESLVADLIDHSYELVLRSLTRAERDRILSENAP